MLVNLMAGEFGTPIFFGNVNEFNYAKKECAGKAMHLLASKAHHEAS